MKRYSLLSRMSSIISSEQTLTPFFINEENTSVFLNAVTGMFFPCCHTHLQPLGPEMAHSDPETYRYSGSLFTSIFSMFAQGQEPGEAGRSAGLARSGLPTPGVRLQLPPHVRAGGRPHSCDGGALLQLQGQHPLLLLVLNHLLPPPALWSPLPPPHPPAG